MFIYGNHEPEFEFTQITEEELQEIENKLINEGEYDLSHLPCYKGYDSLYHKEKSQINNYIDSICEQFGYKHLEVVTRRGKIIKYGF